MRQQLDVEKNGLVGVLIVHLRMPRRLQPMLHAREREALLLDVDRRIEQCLREVDRYTRFSDETLCVALSGLGNEAQAVLAAVRITSSLADDALGDDTGGPVAAYVGIALSPRHGRNPDLLLVRAEAAAQAAAHETQGYRVYELDSKHAIDMTHVEIEARLAEAIRHNELPVHYQPQIRISDGACIGAEALLRWVNDDTGRFTIDRLVAIAETAGMIEALTLCVIHTVLRHASDFRKNGVKCGVSINISASMLMEMEFPELVRQALETWDVPPESLTFEITESAMIADVDRSLPILQRLRDMDVRLSVDDFGTGYSSLAYLKLLPVQELKIDKLFVANMGVSRGDTQIVQSMIELAHSFGMSALAEGVENDACLADLRKMNCDLAQGYHFSPALPHADFMLWIGSRSA